MAVVVEGGQGPTYTVVLDSAPTGTGDVIITPSVGPSTNVTVSPTSLTFTSGNWATAQTVTVTAAADDIIEGTQPLTITHSITATTDTNYPTLMITDVTANVYDTSAHVTISATTLAVTEGVDAEYTVVLLTMPTGNVGILPSADFDFVAFSELTFTTTDWNTAQPVTVAAAVDDDIYKAAITRDILHFVVSSEDTTNYPNSILPIHDARITVTITDDDIAGVSVSATEVTAAETGATGSYTIVLDTQPPSSVDISVTSENTNNITVEPTSLTFTAGATDNWATPQTVIVTAVNDSFDDDDNMTTITHEVTTENSQYTSSLSIASVTATATDDDTAGVFVLGSRMVTATEDGQIAIYNIELGSEPSANVVVSVTSEDTDNITVHPPFLTFTSGPGGDWDDLRDVTVTAVNDDVDDDDNMTTITHMVTSGDTQYTTNLFIASVTATATDNDTAGVTIPEVFNTPILEGGPGLGKRVDGEYHIGADTCCDAHVFLKQQHIFWSF